MKRSLAVYSITFYAILVFAQSVGCAPASRGNGFRQVDESSGGDTGQGQLGGMGGQPEVTQSMAGMVGSAGGMGGTTSTTPPQGGAGDTSSMGGMGGTSATKMGGMGGTTATKMGGMGGTTTTKMGGMGGTTATKMGGMGGTSATTMMGGMGGTSATTMMGGMGGTSATTMMGGMGGTTATVVKKPRMEGRATSCANDKGLDEDLIADFPDQTLQTYAVADRTPAGTIISYDDGTTGTRSLTVTALNSVHCGSAFAMKLVGSGFDIWGLAVSVPFKGGMPRPLVDVSRYKGVRFFARADVPVALRLRFGEKNTSGDGGVCDVEKNQCFDHWGRELLIGMTWRTFEVFFNDLDQNRPNIFGPIVLDQIYGLELTVPHTQTYAIEFDDFAFIP